MSKLNSYRQAQTKFDGAVRYAKRTPTMLSTSKQAPRATMQNPKAFWKYINNLGVRAKSKHSASVIHSNGKEGKWPED